MLDILTSKYQGPNTYSVQATETKEGKKQFFMAIILQEILVKIMF